VHVRPRVQQPQRELADCGKLTGSTVVDASLPFTTLLESTRKKTTRLVSVDGLIG
jgi:hypothetical protein